MSYFDYLQKRKVFVSYDHDDTDQVNGFMGLRNLPGINFDFINKKLDYEIQSQSDEYKRRVIREKFIRSASVTAVLIGVNYYLSKWSNWEIEDSIQEGNGLVAIALKGVERATLPSEFQKYLNKGLVYFRPWQPEHFQEWIEEAYQNRELLQKTSTEIL
ncbi:MAG: TIR domain-containing protein [Candidatus Omnitrophica bacterium]|nr:TIR domain-containing protein [Candidatus Omnitrophota bacterium]